MKSIHVLSTDIDKPLKTGSRLRAKLTELRAKLNGNRAASLTMWLLFSQLLAAGVSFVVNIIAAYGLEPDQRGLLAFYLQIGYLLTTFLLLGAEKPFIARIQDTFPASVAVLLQILRPSYGIVVLVALISIVLYFSGVVSVAIPLALLVVFILCNQHVRIVRSAYITSGSLKPFLSVMITTNLLTLIFAFILAIMQHDNFLTWLLVYVVANVIATVFVAHSSFVTRNNESVRRGPIREIRREGLKLLPASLGNIAMFRPDRVLLPILASPADLGVYIVVSAALEVAVWPIQLWSDSKMGDWYQTKPFKNQRLRLAIFGKTALGVLGLSVVLSIFLVAIVVWILPEGYGASLNLLVPITIANIIYGITRVQQGVAIAGNRSGLVSTAEVTGFVVAVGAYILLIPLFGGLGAAVGSVIGYTACFIVTEIGIRAKFESTS